jgi:centromere protein J
LEKRYEDGKVEVVFKNGAIRESFPNGYMIVNYTIGDIKQTLPDGSIIYFYSDQDTTQITLPTEGLNVDLPDLDLSLQ